VNLGLYYVMAAVIGVCVGIEPVAAGVAWMYLYLGRRSLVR
jgi:hypothetical protein